MKYNVSSDLLRYDVKPNDTSNIDVKIKNLKENVKRVWYTLYNDTWYNDNDTWYNDTWCMAHII
jgi:hypothetical protein